jgi:hypothetical protein
MHWTAWTQSTMSETSASALDDFFSRYGRTYDPLQSPHTQWHRLRRSLRRRQASDAVRAEARAAYLDAVADEFNGLFGVSLEKLDGLQALCTEVHIQPVPVSITECLAVRPGRCLICGPTTHTLDQAIERIFVNIIDLIRARRSGRHDVHVFRTERELSAYTIATGKIFPRDHTNAGNLLKFLLRHIFHPRDENE